MTTVQELTSSIINDARDQAEQVDAETEAELTRIHHETQEMLEKERERMYLQAKREQEMLAARAEGKRQLEASQKTLSYKQGLIDAAFRQAAHDLEHMPAAKRRKLLQHLWQRASRQIKVTGVIAAKKDAHFFKVKKTAAPGIGGFIATGTNVRVDMRFETLLADIKARKTAQVAKILFGEKRAPKTIKGPSKVKRKRK